MMSGLDYIASAFSYNFLILKNTKGLRGPHMVHLLTDRPQPFLFTDQPKKLNCVKPWCWKPPGHYLCIPEPGRLGCIIPIEKGVKGDAYPVAISQKVMKNLPVAFYSPTPGLNFKRFQRRS